MIKSIYVHPQLSPQILIEIVFRCFQPFFFALSHYFLYMFPDNSYTCWKKLTSLAKWRVKFAGGTRVNLRRLIN